MLLMVNGLPGLGSRKVRHPFDCSPAYTSDWAMASGSPVTFFFLPSNVRLDSDDVLSRNGGFRYEDTGVDSGSQ